MITFNIILYLNIKFYFILFYFSIKKSNLVLNKYKVYIRMSFDVNNKVVNKLTILLTDTFHQFSEKGSLGSQRITNTYEANYFPRRNYRNFTRCLKLIFRQFS